MLAPLRRQWTHLDSRRCSVLQSNLPPRAFRRRLVTLAIETSCDDTSVAVLEHTPETTALHFHEKVTSDNAAFRGVHPIVSLESHQENLARLIDRAVASLPEALRGEGRTVTCNRAFGRGDASSERRLPDFVSVTRGPGMRSNLTTGLDTAKGLAVAWQVPLVGVHHMQAHALTPRLVSALRTGEAAKEEAGRQRGASEPEFPFVSLLVSGGHTLLVHSRSLTTHRILASTSDIAIGDCLDKIARCLLPSNVVTSSTTTMYGALLEHFVFTNPATGYDYFPPKTLAEQLKRRPTPFGWSLPPPFASSPNNSRSRSAEFSFSGLVSAVERIVRHGADLDTGKSLVTERDRELISTAELRLLGREAMRVAFEHAVGRSLLALEQLEAERAGALESTRAFVASGGVAANGFLRQILREMLDARGFGHVKLEFPPLELCTDNAAMVAWAGMEMYGAGVRTDLGVRALRKWPLDQIMKEVVKEK